MNECKDCGNKLQKTTIPKTLWSFAIPFTPFTLELWNWESEDWFCFDCSHAEEERPYEDAYNAGLERGHEEAFREAQVRLYE
ncbi:hypothetical protein LCGC14_1426360 [marine sediment metagenome]|uniref:Uncharacterized protein n=1 Tax=marine sediment metagenome TaxID=412755 RepID=A0A0F9MRL8_9ZZZZ